MNLVKVSNDFFQFYGDVEYRKLITKCKDFDGETYINTTFEDIKTNVCELRKNEPQSFFIETFDFDLLKYQVKIQDKARGSFAKENTYRNYSENDTVNLITYAFEEGLLDKRIKGVCSGKTRGSEYCKRDYMEDWDIILKSLAVWIPLFSYGFNNSVSYKISLETLLECDSELIPNNIKDIFLRFDIDLNSKNKLQQVTKLLTQKIRKV